MFCKYVSYVWVPIDCILGMQAALIGTSYAINGVFNDLHLNSTTVYICLSILFSQVISYCCFGCRGNKLLGQLEQATNYFFILEIIFQ